MSQKRTVVPITVLEILRQKWTGDILPVAKKLLLGQGLIGYNSVADIPVKGLSSFL